MARLIDVDKVINSMQKCLDENPDQKDSVAYFAFDAIITALKQEPTVDAVPVVHGDWVDGRPYVNSRWKVCSVCHQTAPEPHGGYNYCPNCGATMDLEVDNA